MMVIFAIVCSQVEGLRWAAVVLSADGHIADAEPAAEAAAEPVEDAGP